MPNLDNSLNNDPEALSIEDQIQNLVNLGLIIRDKEAAAKFLSEVSYYRLIKPYSEGLKKPDGTYRRNVTFDNIKDLYLFNKSLTELLLPYLRRFEITFRCRVQNTFCVNHGKYGYEDPESFIDTDTGYEVKSDLNRILSADYIQSSLIYRHYQKEPYNGRLPFYAIVELMSFSSIGYFYMNMKREDRAEIADIYGVDEQYLQSWVISFASVRNVCAHYDRLYGKAISKPPRLMREDREGVQNNSLFAVLLCLRHVYKKDSVIWESLVDNIMGTFIDYPMAEINKLGFPEEWEYRLLGRDPDKTMEKLINALISGGATFQNQDRMI